MSSQQDPPSHSDDDEDDEYIVDDLHNEYRVKEDKDLLSQLADRYRFTSYNTGRTTGVDG
jgi:hypothetical protein